MVIRMADGERPTTEHEQSPQVMNPAGAVVDFGVARLEVPVPASTAAEITEFIVDNVFIESDVTSEKSEKISSTIGQRVGRLIMAVCGGIAWLIRSLFGIASLILLLAAPARHPDRQLSSALGLFARRSKGGWPEAENCEMVFL